MENPINASQRKPLSANAGTRPRHLLEALERATGAEEKIDVMIADSFGLERNDYTGSAFSNRELVKQLLPGSKLQVGYDVNGVLPSATLNDGHQRFSSVAPTVPLAILRVLMQAIVQRSC